ncbi:MAG: hypothetical protein ACR2NT_08330 [Acidimicrobiia bacterium]
MSQADETSVDQFIIYGGYGEVMHLLQVLELSLWMIQTRSIKSRTPIDQAMAKVEKWDATTLGDLMRGMRTQSHWPDGLVDRLLKAVKVRNYLAHHYLREYFIVTPSEANRERAAQELADLSVWLEQLIGDLDDHTRSLGVAGFEQLDEETAREIDAFRPVEWLSMPTRPDGD